jgi:maltose-binding protein MalE
MRLLKPGWAMPPPTCFARLGQGVLALAMTLTLGGCGSWELPGSHALFIYVQNGIGGNNNAAVRSDDEDLERQRLLQGLIDRYRRKNPKARIHVRSFPAEELGPEMRLRQNSGLGPDLVVSDVRVAFDLHEQGLTTPVRIPAERLHNMARQVLRPFEQKGALMALPLSLQPQIACYNRQRIPEPPRSLQQVLELAAKGHRVGLPVQISDLAWTASGLADADQPLLLASIQSDRIPAAQQLAARRALAAWIDWIRMASLQQYVVFTDSNEELYAQFLNGELDWIPCRSLRAKLLQTKLGSHFGATPLPGRDPGQPAAVTVKLAAWSFGHHSSGMQQQLAKDFALFSLNELNQKELMLKTQSSLPVNTQVMVPSKSSQLLAAMQIGLEHGILLDFSRRALMLNSSDGKLQTLVRQAVLGESGTRP